MSAAYTTEELREFDRITSLTSSRDNAARIMGRLQLTKFTKEHGTKKCDAMFKALTEKQKDVDQFALKKPCKHCPFSPAKGAIRFRCKERAEEIAESAYRKGFPCHKSAIEDDDAGGFVFGADTQHCAGALMMFANEGNESGWPGIENDENRVERIMGQMDWTAPHFECEQDFIDANTPKARRKRK